MDADADCSVNHCLSFPTFLDIPSHVFPSTVSVFWSVLFLSANTEVLRRRSDPLVCFQESQRVVPAAAVKPPVPNATQEGANRGTGCRFLLPLLPQGPPLHPHSVRSVPAEITSVSVSPCSCCCVAFCPVTCQLVPPSTSHIQVYNFDIF